MINLQIAETFTAQIDAGLLTRAAEETLKHSEKASGSDLTIVMTGDAEIQQLNRDFLEIDAPTDVLSFPADYTDPDTDANYLGDVIISYPRAVEQAAAGGHPLNAELQLLVTHGVLHLLGFDHAEPEEKEEMWSVQAEILSRLGIDPSTMPIE